MDTAHDVVSHRPDLTSYPRHAGALSRAAGPVLGAAMVHQLAAAGDPSRIVDLAAVRTNFEGLWVATNAVRTVALACLGRALSLHGRVNERAPRLPVGH